MNEGRVVIQTPLYLVSTKMKCWRCDSDMPAICLIASSIDGSEESGALMLSKTFWIPPVVLKHVQGIFPNFKLRRSQMGQTEYFANVCPKCNVITGDYFLHREPDSPFWPFDEEEAKLLFIQQIPVEGPIELDTEYYGSAATHLIINNAQRI